MPEKTPSNDITELVDFLDSDHAEELLSEVNELSEDHQSLPDHTSPAMEKIIGIEGVASILEGVDMNDIEEISIRKLLDLCVQTYYLERHYDAGAIIDFLTTLRSEEELTKMEPVVELVRCKVKRFRAIDKRLLTDDDWVLHVERPDLRVYYSKYSPNGLISFRMDGLIENASVTSILSVMYELEMFSGWTPFYRFPRMGLMSAKKVKFLGPNVDFVARLAVGLPWPMTDREAWLTCHGCDDFRRTRRLIIGLESTNPENPVEKRGKLREEDMRVEGKFTRLDVQGGVAVEVITENCVKMQLIWDVDFKMSVPQSLVQFFSKMFMGAGFDDMVKHIMRVEGKNKTPQSNKPGSASLGGDPVPDCSHEEYQKRIHDPSSPFYVLVKKVLEDLKFEKGTGLPYSIQAEPEDPKFIFDRLKLETIAAQKTISLEALVEKIQNERFATSIKNDASSQHPSIHKLATLPEDLSARIVIPPLTSVQRLQSFSSSANPQQVVTFAGGESERQATMGLTKMETTETIKCGHRAELATSMPQTTFAPTLKALKKQKKGDASCCSCFGGNKKRSSSQEEEAKKPLPVANKERRSEFLPKVSSQGEIRRKASVCDPLDREVELIASVRGESEVMTTTGNSTRNSVDRHQNNDYNNKKNINNNNESSKVDDKSNRDEKITGNLNVSLKEEIASR